MSGGHWFYKNDDAAREIFGWSIDINYGKRGFGESTQARKLNPLEDKLLSELVWDMFCLLHSYDWYRCGDICKETYKADVKYFKEKWLKLKDEVLIERCISDAIADLKDELKITLGLEHSVD